MNDIQESMNRRVFSQTLIGASLAGAFAMKAGGAEAASSTLLLGGPVGGSKDPADWTAKHKELGYRAAYCPLQPSADDATVRAYEAAAQKAGLVIAEVGAWSNPMSADEGQRKAALEKCQTSLDLADRIGARCCVNITGSRGANWAGPDAKNLTDETFDMIVETTRSIIDAVKPTRSFYTLEMMQWAYPDSVDSYLQLIRAIDRERVAVHLDPVNIVNCPERYYNTGALIRDCFKRLGPMIRSCHGKDVIMTEEPLVHLSEIRPGLGNLDYTVFLKELRKLPDVPLMLEHLPNQEEYKQAADYVRSVDAKI